MVKNDDPRTVLARLIRERREDFAALSRMLGRNQAYIQQYIKRGVPRRLSERDRQMLARYFGIDEVLLGGLPSGTGSGSGSGRGRGDGLILVPRLEVGAAAGHGVVNELEMPQACIGFEPRLLRQITSAPAEMLSIIQVRGDSMSPTLSDGEDIMVDRSPSAVRLSDGIYVLRRDDLLAVKRIAVHPGTRQLTISSDNSAYPTWHDCDPAEFDVVGRVIWAARRIG